jgi:hypothetical protein
VSAAVAPEPTPAGPGAAFVEAAEAALAAGDPARVGDADLAAVMTAAVRLYAAKTEAADATPLAVVVPERLTPTEVVVAASALIHAAGLNLFDLAMWFRRG